MEKLNHNDRFSIAVDKALLKLSKEFGISLPKDDYVLIEIFLNREIIEIMLNDQIRTLKEENEKSKQFFRRSLIEISKQHSEKTQSIKNYGTIIRGSLISSSLALIVSIISLISNLVGG